MHLASANRRNKIKMVNPEPVPDGWSCSGRFLFSQADLSEQVLYFICKDENSFVVFVKTKLFN